MDGHDEWENFTDDDVKKMNTWNDMCDKWHEGFVKSRRKTVWMVCAMSLDSLYAPDIRLFDNRAAAYAYAQQLKDSPLGRLYKYTNIRETPVYASHKLEEGADA